MNELSSVVSHFPIGTLTKSTLIKSGLIHTTYRIETADGTYILQRMSHIFAVEVLEDVVSVTKYLKASGLRSFDLVTTTDGALSFFDGTHHWRLLTYIPGRIVTGGGTLVELKSAGRLVGKLHDVLRDFKAPLKHRIPGFHETEGYMEKLFALDDAQRGTEKYKTLHPLRVRVEEAYRALPAVVTSFPARVLHGDLKIENVLFSETGEEAIAIIDLDTVGMYPLLIEVGDMAWSWTKVPESVPPTFSPERWEATFSGYKETCTSLTPDEWNAFPHGAVLTALELTARFINDAYEESYFAHDKTKYESLFVQNLKMAEDLLGFFDDFNRKRSAIMHLHE